MKRTTELIAEPGERVEVRWPQYDPDDWAPATLRETREWHGQTWYVVEEFTTMFHGESIRKPQAAPEQQ